MVYRLTAAVPMFRSKDIGWLCLEGLSRQEGVDFEWELIVMEEETLDPMGIDAVESYRGRLEKVGCTKVTYVPLAEWIPLGLKWHRMAQMADSEGFMLVAADDYAQPQRLLTTHKLLKGDAEWVQTPKGPFFDTVLGNFVLFDYAHTFGNPCALNMACLTKLAKMIPASDQVRNVDSWFYKSIVTKLRRKLNIVWDKTEGWRHGVYTNGFNNISQARVAQMGGNRQGKPILPYRDPTEDEPQSLEDCVPKDVAKRLRNIMQIANNRRYVPLVGSTRHG